jgi:hypothetical protein
MSAVFVVKEKIEELQKRVDLALDEKGLRDFTRGIVRDIVGIEVSSAKDEVHKVVSDSADKLVITQKILEKRADVALDKTKVEVMSQVDAGIKHLQDQHDVLKYQVKILSVILGIACAIGIGSFIL